MGQPIDTSLEEALDQEFLAQSMADSFAEELHATIKSTPNHGPASHCSAFIRMRDTAPEGTKRSTEDTSRCTLTFPDGSKLFFWEGTAKDDYALQVTPAPEIEHNR